MTEIVLLILGIALFAAGYLLPEKKSVREIDTSQEEERIRAFVEQQLADLKSQVNDMSGETVQYSMEKTERALERLTNEKIMAVEEYSNTVLQEIHRNHEEVMFLYDMLNDKHTNLKNTVKEVTRSAREAKETAQDAQIAVQEARETAQNVIETVAEAAETVEERVLTPLDVPVVEPGERRMVPQKAERQTEKAASRKGGKTQEKPGGEKAAAAVAASFAGEDDKANSNERILEMHKAGKSNMAIARELGLGLGEVKLVIDLFEGM